MGVNPYHSFSNESKITYQDISDFKLKNPFGLHGLSKNNSALQGLSSKGQETSTYIIFIGVNTHYYKVCVY